MVKILVNGKKWSAKGLVRDLSKKKKQMGC